MSSVQQYSSESDQVDNAVSQWPVKGPAGGEDATQMMIVGFKPKSAQITALPSGWLQVKRKNSSTEVGASVLLTSSLGSASTQAQDLNLQFDVPTQGTWGSVSFDGDFEGAIEETDQPFGTVHALTAKTATRDGSCVYGLKATGGYPKLSAPRAPLASQNITEKHGLQGPATVINAAPADDGDTITPTWDSTDAFGNPSNDGDAFTGFTVLVAPRDQNTISGGGIIPIRGVKSVDITSAPQSVDQGQTANFVVNVVGTDDQPFEGVTVSAVASGGGTFASDQVASDASGNATFVFTAGTPGSHSVTVSADAEEDLATFTVNAVASQAADAVALTASFSAVKAGQSITLFIQANVGGQAAVDRIGALTYNLPGGSEVVEPFTTNNLGQFSRLLTPQQVGTLVVDASVDAANATTLNITVEAAPPLSASPSSATATFPGDPVTISVRRGTALAPGLPVVSNNPSVATASSLTTSSSEIVITPISIGSTLIVVSYIDSATGAQTTLEIPITVSSAAATDEINQIKLRNGLPNIVLGDPPSEVEFVNQDDIAIPDDNKGRLVVVQDKPQRVAISHAGDDGKFWIYATGAGETSFTASYIRTDGTVVRKSFTFTVLSS